MLIAHCGMCARGVYTLYMVEGGEKGNQGGGCSALPPHKNKKTNFLMCPCTCAQHFKVKVIIYPISQLQ